MARFLFRLALALLVIATLPLVSVKGPFLSVAMADDDGDNGDDGDDDRDDDDKPDRSGNSDGNGTRDRTRPGGSLLDLLLGRTPRPRGAQPPAAGPLATRAEDEIVVLDLSQGDLQALIARGFEERGAAEVATLGTTIRRLEIPSGTTPEAALEEVRQLASGQAADFNHFYRTSEGITPSCEGLHCTSFEQVAWAPPIPALASCGQPTARIGLIDTGVNPDHEAFADSRLSVLDVKRGDKAASGAQHGTAVAAILIASRGGRTHGLLPDAQLVAVDAFHADGRDERSDVFSLVQAMDRLAAASVNVINMSLAGPHNSLLERMVMRLYSDQILIVSAAGNGGARAAPVFPGAYGPVLTVTAVDASGRVYRRAGRGPHLDLAAPGVDVWTAASVRGVRTKTGTSFATPFATAAAAMLMSERPDLTVAEVKDFLRATALDLGEEGPDEVFGAGLVQFAPICAGPTGAQSQSME
ncbi:S8 family serine peptidase [Roseobacter sp. YSTF-M11]|uniref:S8 family serine peptidase n=1 Tax=Roseobacter insulae TaxID=2859783 RepID=A0A9X1JZE2_9RHOB|nr:S8 family serine peptidase [Roseobacter insulae]MBW4709200.1 S8 family serine peptidase [Roseobacter insulae]